MSEASSSIRLDKWLWYARVVKTRTLAQKLVKDGSVRLNGNRSKDPASKVRSEDVLTITLATRIKIYKIVALGTRRGPAPEAQALYEDLSPPPIPKPKRPICPAPREPGTGRPTKKERRETDRFLKSSRDEF